MEQVKNNKISLYLTALGTGFTGWLGAFYFIGCYGIAMFGENRLYPYYMPFGKGMIIVCGITCLFLLVNWVRSLEKIGEKGIAILISVLMVMASLLIAIVAYGFIDLLALLAKRYFIP